MLLSLVMTNYHIVEILMSWLIVFTLFLLILPFLHPFLLFLSPQFCLDQFSVTTGQIVLKFGGMV